MHHVHTADLENLHAAAAAVAAVAGDAQLQRVPALGPRRRLLLGKLARHAQGPRGGQGRVWSRVLHGGGSVLPGARDCAWTRACGWVKRTACSAHRLEQRLQRCVQLRRLVAREGQADRRFARVQHEPLRACGRVLRNTQVVGVLCSRHANVAGSSTRAALPAAARRQSAQSLRQLPWRRPPRRRERCAATSTADFCSHHASPTCTCHGRDPP